MNSTQKSLSVKTRVICRGVFRIQSSSYHGAFFSKEKLAAFSWRSSHRRCPITFRKSTQRHLWHSLLGVFLWFFWNPKNTFLQKQNRATASELLTNFTKKLHCRYLKLVLDAPFISSANELTSFYMIRIFTETLFSNKLLRSGF